MPGSAIAGSPASDTASGEETGSCCRDIAASVPSTRAIIVDSSPTTTEVRNASSAPALSAARDHQVRVKPDGGQRTPGRR